MKLKKETENNSSQNKRWFYSQKMIGMRWIFWFYDFKIILKVPQMKKKIKKKLVVRSSIVNFYSFAILFLFLFLNQKFCIEKCHIGEIHCKIVDFYWLLSTFLIFPTQTD